MKKYLALAMLITAGMTGSAQFRSASLTAGGLTCALCSKAIFNSLSKLPSVEKVDVDIASSIYQIEFKHRAHVEPDDLRNAVEEAGFSVSRLELTGSFDGLDIEHDSHRLIGGSTYHFLLTDKKRLQGEHTITIVDKAFVSPRTFKKFRESSKHSCVETGKAGHCCPTESVAGTGKDRIYHVTL